MSGRFRALVFNLIHTGIRFAAAVFESYAGATRVADHERAWRDPIMQVTYDDRTVGGALLGRSKRKAASVCGDPDVRPGSVNLQDGFVVVDAWRLIPIAVIKHNPTL